MFFYYCTMHKMQVSFDNFFKGSLCSVCFEDIYKSSSRKKNRLKVHIIIWRKYSIKYLHRKKNWMNLNFLRYNGIKPFMKSQSHIRFDMIITKFLIVHVTPNRFLPHCVGPKMSDILSFQSKLESSKRKETAIFQTCCVTRRNFSFLSPFWHL